jgi:hypothetical protein
LNGYERGVELMELLPSDAGSEQSVTISLRDYRALMEDRAALIRLRGVSGHAICWNPRSHFRSDGEIVSFLNQHATNATIQWLTDELRRLFGAERAPSRAAVGRYVRRVRLELGVAEVRGRRGLKNPK